MSFFQKENTENSMLQELLKIKYTLNYSFSKANVCKNNCEFKKVILFNNSIYSLSMECENYIYY